MEQRRGGLESECGSHVRQMSCKRAKVSGAGGIGREESGVEEAGRRGTGESDSESDSKKHCVTSRRPRFNSRVSTRPTRSAVIESLSQPPTNIWLNVGY